MKISGKTNNISYAHANDGGADLRSNEDTIICAGSQTLVIRACIWLFQPDTSA